GHGVSVYPTANGKNITAGKSGGFGGCPCANINVTIVYKNTCDIKSYTIEDFDYDKDGKTAEEYFKWRFDRMILWKMGEVLPAPLNKILKKLTLKKLGRLLFFKVDDSIKDRLAIDVSIEFVRNIFLGNEPYVKGTPMYEAVAKFLKRLHFVTHILEKKLGKKNPMLADIDSFVLSMIGDEEQRDHNLKLKINRG
ncbi:MAG: hypothetical protein K2K01_07430, partial [Eubacterium sp.]|nr:hypothetical protein [Eubacterium sp.]